MLGGRGTYVRARLGGLQGRALAAGDLLPLAPPSAKARQLAELVPPGRTAPWGVGLPGPQPLGGAVEVRALRGSHFRALTPASRNALLAPAAWSSDAAAADALPPSTARWFEVTGESDRMGFRLR